MAVRLGKIHPGIPGPAVRQVGCRREVLERIMVRAVRSTASGGGAGPEAALEPRPADPSRRRLIAEIANILLRHEGPTVVVADIAGGIRITVCVRSGRDQPLRPRSGRSVHAAEGVVRNGVLRGEPPVVLQRRRGIAGGAFVIAERQRRPEWVHLEAGAGAVRTGIWCGQIIAVLQVLIHGPAVGHLDHAAVVVVDVAGRGLGRPVEPKWRERAELRAVWRRVVELRAGRDAVAALSEGSEIVIEGNVLLVHDDRVLDQALARLIIGMRDRRARQSDDQCRDDPGDDLVGHTSRPVARDDRISSA